MTTLTWITLFAAMVALAAIPSASVALVVTRSATRGIQDGISVACGILLGDLIFVVLAILGMGILAETLGPFFIILRYVGGAYLVWFGLSLIRSKGRAGLIQSETSKLSLFASFTSGFLLTIGDIKAILFYASLFPAFVDMSSLQVSDIIGIVTVTIMAVGGVKVFYAYSAQGIAKRFQNRNAQKISKSIAGCGMVCAGVYILTKT